MEVTANVEIVETGAKHDTPFTIQLAVGTYTLKAIYEGQVQEKPANIVEGEITKVDFNFEASTRKGAPSSSGIVIVRIKPKNNEREETTLTLTFDKATYVSAEPMVLSGNLVFTADHASLDGRIIAIEENGVEIGTMVTGVDGSYNFNCLAPTVLVETDYGYEAKFGGDL